MSKLSRRLEKPTIRPVPEFIPIDILCCVCHRRIQTWDQYTFFYAPHHTFCRGQLEDLEGNPTPAGTAVFQEFLVHNVSSFFQKWIEIAQLPAYDVKKMMELAITTCKNKKDKQ